MKKILIITLVMSLMSCTPIVKLFYGIKNPKIENEQSIIEYLQKNEMRTDNVFSVDFENFKPMFDGFGSSIPEVMIFDKNGAYIPYGDEWACNASAFSFIQDLDRSRIYIPSDKTTIAKATNGMVDLKGEPVLMSSPDTDFYVVIFWTKYLGKLNKDHVKIWEEHASQNKTANLEVIKINMDFQEHWGEENLKKLVD